MKGLALVMDAPPPSDDTIVKGPDTSAAGAAAKPSRPPGTTPAVMQR